MYVGVAMDNGKAGLGRLSTLDLGSLGETGRKDGVLVLHNSHLVLREDLLNNRERHDGDLALRAGNGSGDVNRETEASSALASVAGGLERSAERDSDKSVAVVGLPQDVGEL
jgi:hypothetical protein